MTPNSRTGNISVYLSLKKKSTISDFSQYATTNRERRVQQLLFGLAALRGMVEKVLPAAKVVRHLRRGDVRLARAHSTRN
jgi:hypothetical protein